MTKLLIYNAEHFKGTKAMTSGHGGNRFRYLRNESGLVGVESTVTYGTNSWFYHNFKK